MTFIETLIYLLKWFWMIFLCVRFGQNYWGCQSCNKFYIEIKILHLRDIYETNNYILYSIHVVTLAKISNKKSL